MELIDMTSLIHMDSGAPSPLLISTDDDLLLFFSANNDEDFRSSPRGQDIKFYTSIFTMKFKSFVKYTFGIPSNETISGHPYSKLGLMSYSFYELKNSNFIKELQEIEKTHPCHDREKWGKFRHYIITFHNNMFDCIAEGFEINRQKTSTYAQAINALKKMSDDRI